MLASFLVLFLALESSPLSHAFPSARQCLRNFRDSEVAVKCREKQKYTVHDMPTDTALFYFSNNSLQPSTKEIPRNFFSVAQFDAQRDFRFSKDFFIPNRNRQLMINRILEEFINFTNDFNLRWWLAHDGLLGWYWNENLKPGDSVIDVMILYHELLTGYSLNDKSLYKSRFLLEINPNSYYRHYQEGDVSDARFIDTTNGLYIDMKAVVYDPERKQLHCKSPHYYDPSDIFPLQNGTFMGKSIWFPNSPEAVLVKEYGKACLTSTTFARPRKIYDVTYDMDYYKFNEDLQVWETDAHPPKYVRAHVGQLVH